MINFPFFASLRRPYISFVGALLIGAVVMLLSIGIYLVSYFYTSGMLLKEPFGLNIDTLDTSHLINIQVLQMISLFVLPAIIYTYFHKVSFLKLYQLESIFTKKQFLYGLLFALAVFPVLLFIQEWVTSLPFPEHIRLMAEEQKKVSELLMEKFLGFSSPLKLVLMISIMGVGAGLTEELFFRGLLLPLIGRFFNNIWVGIFLSGFIFGLMHSSFYDLIPISIIGFIFGYIYYKTNNLWLTIFIHAFYNSSQVFLNYLFTIKAINFDIDSLENISIFVVIPCAFLATFLIQKLTQNTSYE